MIKMILKRALILGLFTFSMHAQTGPTKEFIANQCYELSQTVVSLATDQPNTTCMDKLYIASTQMNTAGSLILEDSTDIAKKIIDNAVSALQYAELNGCNRYIQISHSKLEANKLKHLL